MTLDKDPRKRLEEIIRQREDTPIPVEVEERLQARLNQFRNSLDMSESDLFLTKTPPFAQPKEKPGIPWVAVMLTGVIIFAAFVGIALMLLV